MAQVQIETDAAAFLASLKNWDGKMPEFHSVIASAVHHVACLSGIGDLQIVLAEEGVPMPLSTVARWASGTARPHPLIQKPIVMRLRRLMEDIVEADRETRGRAIAAMRQIGDSPDE